MKKLLIAFAFVLGVNNYTHAQDQFEINGTAPGFADGTVFFLDDITQAERVRIDSALVTNQQFHFKGRLKTVAVHVVLRTVDFSDYVFFWLENSIITITAEKGKFRAALIKGSKTQDEQNLLVDKEKTIGNERRADIDFVKQNPNSIVSAYILNVYASTWGKDTTEMLYNNLSTNIKSTSYGESILEFITLNKNLKAGDRYVDFSQPNSENKKISVSDFKGKVILLDFWASWCAPCRQQNPELVKIYKQYKEKGLEIIGVSLDRQSERQEWLDAIKRDGLSWPNVSDLKGDKNQAALIYGIAAIPDNFLIDKNGVIVARNLHGQQLKERIARLLR